MRMPPPEGDVAGVADTTGLATGEGADEDAGSGAGSGAGAAAGAGAEDAGLRFAGSSPFSANNAMTVP
ncbi:MAG TPA: hypothetical protein DEQ73_08730, partial [Phycisphaerales bacterium]|nr:hypothetical protein [Phycisphaerales bacterium]